VGKPWQAQSFRPDPMPLGLNVDGREITLEICLLFPDLLGQLCLSTLTAAGREVFRNMIEIAMSGKEHWS
jgi:hypothetical protein